MRGFKETFSAAALSRRTFSNSVLPHTLIMPSPAAVLLQVLFQGSAVGRAKSRAETLWVRSFLSSFAYAQREFWDREGGPSSLPGPVS